MTTTELHLRRHTWPRRTAGITVPPVRPFTAFVLLLLIALIVGTFAWKLQTTGLTL